MLERWEHYQGEASGIGVRGYGGTEALAFEQAALALTAAVAEPARVAPSARVVIHCHAPSEDLLLAAWLDAVRRKMGSSGMLFSRFEVWIDGLKLTAHAWGEAVDPQRHVMRRQLGRPRPDSPRVARHGDGWLAQAIMDL